MTRALLMLAAALVTFAAPAQDVAPDALVKSVTHEVLGIIKQDKDIQAGNRKKTSRWSRRRCCRTSTSRA